MRKGFTLAFSLSIFMLVGGALYFPGCSHNTIPDDPVMAIMPQVNHWDISTFPLVLEVDTHMDPHVSEQVLTAAEYWNDLLNADVFEINESNLNEHRINGELQRPGFGVVYLQVTELTSRTPPKRNYLGLTRTYYNHDSTTPHEIYSAIVSLDDDLLLSHEVLTVTIHELGHVLGLEHDTDIQSIMYPFALRSGGRVMPDDILYVQRQMEMTTSPF